MGVTRWMYLMKKLFLLTLIGLATLTETAQAQWGVGAGAEQWDFRPDGAASQENNTGYFYGLLGVSITALPVLEPYMEYRFSNFQDVDSAAQEFRQAKGRFHIGMTLRF